MKLEVIIVKFKKSEHMRFKFGWKPLTCIVVLNVSIVTFTIISMVLSADRKKIEVDKLPQLTHDWQAIPFTGIEVSD